MAPDAKVINDWGNALQDITDQQLAEGAKGAQSFTGYFNLPAFRQLCTNSTEYPSEREAYLEAMNHAHEWKTWKFSHEVVLAALKMSNVTAIKSMLERYSTKIYYRNYRIICKAHSAGLPINARVPEALPEKIERTMTGAQRKLKMAESRKITGV